MTTRDVSYQSVKTISGLLAEYSTKLRSLTEQWERQRRRILVATYAWLGVVAIILVTAITLYGSKPPVYLFVFVVVALTFIPYLHLLSEEKRKARLVKENTRIMAIRMEKLIRKASQIEEHGREETNSILELDLRLAEAEGALQFVEGILKTI